MAFVSFIPKCYTVISSAHLRWSTVRATVKRLGGWLSSWFVMKSTLAESTGTADTSPCLMDGRLFSIFATMLLKPLRTGLEGDPNC